jgi:glutathione peroxidase
LKELDMTLTLTRWIGIVALIAGSSLPVVANAADCPPVLKHDFTRLQDGKPMPMCQYAGKVVLVVNTASYCGFTSQYDGLEKLYARLKDKGLVVVGFPSNDFGEQEPGSDKEIADFCRLTYGVEFPMASKTVVKGKNANPFYQKLAEMTDSRPKWNFHKYLISRDGSKVVAFGSTTTPDDKALLAKVDEFLAK